MYICIHPCTCIHAVHHITPHYLTLHYIRFHFITIHYIQTYLHTYIHTYIYIYICMYLLYMRIFCVYNISTCLYLFVHGCISLKSFEIQFQSHSKPEIARPDTIASAHQKGKNLSFRAFLKSHFI